MITATSTTQLALLEEVRGTSQPIDVIAASFAKFATTPSSGGLRAAIASATKPSAADRSRSAGERQSGSAR